MFAVIETGGRQLRVEPTQMIRVEKIEGEVGDTVTFDHVLLVGEEEELRIGTPVVPGVQVIAKIIEQGKKRKILVGKFKRRKKYRRLYGHRQHFTGLIIKEIVA